MNETRPDVLATPWQDTPDYAEYVRIQAEKTAFMRDNQALKRRRNLALNLVTTDRRLRKDLSVLSIGSRNTFELDMLRSAGYGSVQGIDLLSMDPEILPMDMHAMTFPDASFDVIFSCHNLEHAYDLDAALREWARVTKPGGTWAIEVPVNYQISLTDRQDVGSLNGLLQALSPYLDHVLWCAEVRGTEGVGVARAVIKVRK